ncbi:hypothetical protein DFH08DRAFT_160408 [Mycena albidolilacea]|uniref:Uncharacterized protein n=1 Tax=Mycena albidolilacea TaxID=1033008 RepID=A0AAD7A1Y5_9AGAR|nr:hypothetical protein DFH08DRAFT_160408 [Mycena albidolilacea]
MVSHLRPHRLTCISTSNLNPRDGVRAVGGRRNLGCILSALMRVSCKSCKTPPNELPEKLSWQLLTRQGTCTHTRQASLLHLPCLCGLIFVPSSLYSLCTESSNTAWPPLHIHSCIAFRYPPSNVLLECGPLLAVGLAKPKLAAHAQCSLSQE